MTPAFETKRLRVFRIEDIIPSNHNTERVLYAAFRTDVDRPMVAATALMWGGWIDWLEVSSEYRRQGFGSEFLTGLIVYLDGGVNYESGSDDGEAFLNAFEADESEVG